MFFKRSSIVLPLVAGSLDCKPDAVDVSNCAPDAESCDFPSGQIIAMTIHFHAMTGIQQ